MMSLKRALRNARRFACHSLGDDSPFYSPSMEAHLEQLKAKIDEAYRQTRLEEHEGPVTAGD